MKSGRLLSILMLLQARGRMTARALSQATEVSERTILRDIDQLSAAGVPVWSERGWQGGFQLQPGWSTQLTGMTEDEANALLLAGLPTAATDLGLGPAAASARLKLVASVPGPWREQAAKVAERLHVDPVDWYRSADTPAHLREAAQAVWQAKRIEVRYASWRGVSRRELEPLGLVLKAGAWYLVARETGKSGARTYRLASLVALQTTKRAFRRPSGFDLAGHWRESAARFESELRPLQATILASPRAMGWLANARQPHAVVPPKPGGHPLPAASWQEVLLPIESVEQGARQMLGHGSEIVVVAPTALRDAVLDLARQILARSSPGLAP